MCMIAFWRDVAVNTLATLLAAAIAFLAARVGGFFSHISWSTIGKTIAAGGTLSAVIVGVVAALVGLVVKLRG
jgi:hypothetical protein